MQVYENLRSRKPNDTALASLAEVAKKAKAALDEPVTSWDNLILNSQLASQLTDKDVVAFLTSFADLNAERNAQEEADLEQLRVRMEAFQKSLEEDRKSREEEDEDLSDFDF